MLRTVMWSSSPAVPEVAEWKELALFRKSLSVPGRSWPSPAVVGQLVRYGKNDPDEDRGAHGEEDVPPAQAKIAVFSSSRKYATLTANITARSAAIIKLTHYRV
jgi:hypothetical protein